VAESGGRAEYWAAASIPFPNGGGGAVATCMARAVRGCYATVCSPPFNPPPLLKIMNSGLLHGSVTAFEYKPVDIGWIPSNHYRVPISLSYPAYPGHPAVSSPSSALFILLKILVSSANFSIQFLTPLSKSLINQE